jgi:hypothetical protein
MEMKATNAGIRKGDQVRVMTGRDKGKTGRVLAVNPNKSTVTVEHASIQDMVEHMFPSVIIVPSLAGCACDPSVRGRYTYMAA